MMTTCVWTAKAGRGDRGGVAEHSGGRGRQEQASEESSVREADSCPWQLLCEAFAVGRESHHGGPTSDGAYAANLVMMWSVL